MKSFFSAAQLFEVLSVFGDVSPEISQRLKYAKYRAALIMKAIKNNEQPPPPDNQNEFGPPPPVAGFPEFPSDVAPADDTPPTTYQRDFPPPPGSSGHQTPRESYSSGPTSPPDKKSTFHSVDPSVASGENDGISSSSEF